MLQLASTHQTAHEQGRPIDYGMVHRCDCSRETATTSSKYRFPTENRRPCERTGGRRPSRNLISLLKLYYFSKTPLISNIPPSP